MAAARPPGPARLGHLGTARAEKGFVRILEAARALAAEPGAPACRFVLQASAPDRASAAALACLRRRPQAHVELVEEALPQAAYARLLHGLDILLLPYDRHRYAERSSGVLLEAVSAGKPAIVPEGTWMSDTLRRFGAGLTLEGGSTAELVAAVRAMVADLDGFARQAREGAALCRRHHSPEALLGRLLSP